MLQIQGWHSSLDTRKTTSRGYSTSPPHQTTPGKSQTKAPSPLLGRVHPKGSIFTRSTFLLLQYGALNP